MTNADNTGDGGQIVEATIVDETPSNELAVQPKAEANLFNTDDPVEVVDRAARIADALNDVIAKKGLYSNIQGGRHVRVEGWQTLGAMLGVTAVCTDTERVDGGWKATVEARTMDGRVVGRADALCTKAESRWRNADDFARLSMAQTRATTKALKGPLGFVVSLAGYESTPAEEMEGVADSEPELPATPPAPVAPPKPITAKRAKEVAQLYKSLGMLGNVQVAIQRLTEETDVPDCSTVAKAAEALKVLTDEQADKAVGWAEHRAAKGVPA